MANFIKYITIALLAAGSLSAQAARIFIPMNTEEQTNHLKAYGVAYAALTKEIEVDWLLNYEGGSFGMVQTEYIEKLCKMRGVSYRVMSDAQYSGVLNS